MFVRLERATRPAADGKGHTVKARRSMNELGAVMHLADWQIRPCVLPLRPPLFSQEADCTYLQLIRLPVSDLRNSEGSAPSLHPPARVCRLELALALEEAVEIKNC
ncbi:hypothetical protein SBA5_970021 [Candidatus Sulfotelmatomonas gaucii]|uniref:Uncharacterized protein n=1 Tax=Candidatus Sulfuritelmatomonas gaucii TaxID=2043161 RepID=A0A2N9MA04_9BACT|nr:hypothetical protein SBA5_970021 [Candidatus Sulfotelmatomonas gaucii]